MEFGWTQQQEALRSKVRSFLNEHLPGNWEEIAALSPGSEAVTAFSRQFCPKLAEAGLLAPHWPAEFGGSDASSWDHFIIGELMWEVGEPRGPQYYNVNWIGPTIMRFGSAEQKEFHVGRMQRGDVVWCQGFSEPSAGSDLAALRTKAERRGERYIVNGSKIWTSYARLADYCFLLARTGSERRAISVFLVPMDRPGITVRPISSVVGDGDLHEVFLDDVEVSEAERLGPENAGWDIARYALSFERVGIPRYALALRTLHRAVAALSADDAFNQAARHAAALAYAACEAARILVYEVVDERANGKPMSGTVNMARVAIVTAEHRVAEFVLDWTPHLFTSGEEPMVPTHHKRAVASGIAVGAAEIQLNLIARNLLELA